MKKLLIVIASSILLISCDNHKRLQTKNTELTKTVFKHFNAYEWEKMANLYIENAEFKDPSLGPVIVKQTRRQIVDKYRKLHEMFPDIHDKVIQIYPSGDKHIIVEFVSTGTAPDGSKFELPICTIFTIENGVITKDFNYYDDF